MFNNQLSFHLTETAIALCASGGENHFPVCLEFAKGFIVDKERITSEEMRMAYELTGLPIPKEPKVWGSVIRILASMKLIIKNGYDTYKNPVGHCRPINVWKYNK